MVGGRKEREGAKGPGDEDARVHVEVGLGGIFKGLSSFLDIADKLAREAPAEIRREGRIGAPGERGTTAVYGFSVKVGSGGRPVVETFGNVREEAGTGPVVDEVREPMVDVFDEGEVLVVVAEMPGVSEEDVAYEVSGDILRLSGAAEDRRYHKELLLPTPVDESRVSRSYKNGILELRLWKTKGK